jgi:hypothetical protein
LLQEIYQIGRRIEAHPFAVLGNTGYVQSCGQMRLAPTDRE